MNLTVPQRNAVSFFSTVTMATKKDLLAAKIDMRAVNALIRSDIVTNVGDTYAVTPEAKKLVDVYKQDARDAVQHDDEVNFHVKPSVRPRPPMPVIEEATRPAPALGEHTAAAARDAEKARIAADRVAKKEAQLAAKASRVARISKKKEPVECLCGCGGVTMRRFVPGHDAKLHGMFLRNETSGVGPAGVMYATSRGWVK